MIVRMTLASLFATALLAGIASSALAADQYKVDPVHSTMTFRIQHLGVAYFYGRFNGPTGTVKWDAEAPENSSFAIEVKSANVDTANAKRDEHLKSPDFFNAAQFPTISFTSTAVKKISDKEFEVTGDLSLHGVTKSITVPLTFVGAGKGMQGEFRAGYEAVFDLKRSEYGMTFMLDNGGLGDDVRLMIGVEGIRE